MPVQMAVPALRNVGKAFVAFLGLLGTLLNVRYPVLPERILLIYSSDASLANRSCSLLTSVGFAIACVAIVNKLNRNGMSVRRQRPKNPFHSLLRVAIWLVGVCSICACADWTFAWVSTRISHAITAAANRESIDLVARDTLEKLRQPSNIIDAYEVATEYLDEERQEEPSMSRLLEEPDRAPLRGAMLVTYVVSAVFFKLGLFLGAATLAACPTTASG